MFYSLRERCVKMDFLFTGLKTVALRSAHHTKRQKSLICTRRTSKNDPRSQQTCYAATDKVSKQVFQELPGGQGKGLTWMPPVHQNNHVHALLATSNPRALFTSSGRSRGYSFSSVYT
jgi:hypothetical protein